MTTILFQEQAQTSLKAILMHAYLLLPAWMSAGRPPVNRVVC